MPDTRRLAITTLLVLICHAPLLARTTTRRTEVPRYRSPAKWLVDRARDHGHRIGGKPTRADGLIVLTLLRAAAELEPNMPEPYKWREDILQALGRETESLAALHSYTQRDPNDIVARLRWIGRSVNRLQTIEARARFIKSQLDQVVDQPLIAADAHRRLAEIAVTQGMDKEAKSHIDSAVKIAPHDRAAVRLAHEILADPDDHAARVQTSLRLITANPTHVSTAWQLAGHLDSLSLHKQAQFWYAYALDVHRAANPGQDPSPTHLFELARSRADGGDLDAALKDCSRAVGIDPGYVRARLLMVHILGKLGRKDHADTRIREIRDHYAKLTDQVAKTGDVRLATEIAWFYAIYDLQPDQAMRFAKIAVAAPNPSEDALRALGFAALAKGDAKTAERILEPLATTDQMAAVGLARAYLATKRDKLAGPVLSQAATLRATGIPHDQIARMLATAKLPVPAASDYPAVKKALADFDAAPLEYYKEPAKFLRFTMSFRNRSLLPGEPWSVLFELANTGPFHISLGEGMLVAPRVLLSVTTSGDRHRKYDHYLLTNLGGTTVLGPGQTVRMSETVDVGPLRRDMLITPQAGQEIVLSGILDPVRSPDGRWTRSLGGLVAKPAKAHRAPVSASKDAIEKLEADLGSDRSDQVLQAATTLLALLAESQEKFAGRLRHKTVAVYAESLTRTLLDRAAKKGGDPVLRARLIESFRNVPLSGTIIRSLAGGLSDGHWLVRFATVWLFADRQGPAFTTVAKRIAKSDPNQLVRDLADAYLAKWKHHPTSRSKPGPTK